MRFNLTEIAVGAAPSEIEGKINAILSDAQLSKSVAEHLAVALPDTLRLIADNSDRFEYALICDRQGVRVSVKPVPRGRNRTRRPPPASAPPF